MLPGSVTLRCVPGRSAMAIFRPGAFLGGNPWQVSRSMYPKRGPGREKRPFMATYRRYASKMSWRWQDMRAMYAKSPANRRWRIHHANILPGRPPFCCTDPSNHARRANLAIPGCFVWASRTGWGRSGARGGVPASARGFITPSALLPQIHRPVRTAAKLAAGLCRLPPKTWRCDGVSLNCHCSAVLF